jgi:hypothetical protein
MVAKQTRGRPKKDGEVFTAAERMRRQRQRKVILSEELQKHGIIKRSFCVESYLYERMELMAESVEGASLNSLMFIAMRDLLTKFEIGNDYSNHKFRFDEALHSANQAAIDQGLVGLFSAVHGEELVGLKGLLNKKASHDS